MAQFIRPYQNHWKQSLTSHYALSSTEQDCRVVIVKRDIIHLYSHIISVVSSVQMAIKLVEVLLVTFGPLTFFYFLVVLFNINVTSSRLHGVVWFSQSLSIPALTRLMMNAFEDDNQQLLIPTKVFLVLYSFWNLDILRSVIPDICLNVANLRPLLC